DDRVFALEYFDDKVYLSGRFADTLHWGGIELSTTGPADFDMFTGSLDADGNFREANSFGGQDDSKEESRGIFQNGDKLYTVMISNSELLVIGEDIYTSDGLSDYLIVGVIGCDPISIDNTIYTHVTGCYGDSTGAIQIAASGGFGGPWQYSVDNGLKYLDAPYFPELTAGEYQVLVIDKENCTEVGDLVALTQPDSLGIEVVSVADITADGDGSIVVSAIGGSAPYTYTLQPGGVPQVLGKFDFAPGDSGFYVVEVNDLGQCGPVATDTIEIKDYVSGVGIDEFGGVELRVFPNPSADLITIEMPLGAAEVSMEVLSLAGQVVMRRQAYTTGGVLRETIDVSDLASGMYMLRVNGQALKSAIVVE
ncbi:MAG: T9SS type A sorting domain-containing protein, partial [Bacteroidetes bacterium]|nr:T9SS type A sorting domain-containing protein [Bacteroidota bacterium]